MTVNPGIEYQLAEDEFRSASTPAEKLQALQKMWATVPRHKSSEGLQQKIKDKIWNALDLIKVFTKQPGKKADYPPIALKKGSTVRTLAEYIHKDFVKKFKYAKVWGKSVKFKGQVLGLNHVLEDEDIVEFHAA